MSESYAEACRRARRMAALHNTLLQPRHSLAEHYTLTWLPRWEWRKAKWWCHARQLGAAMMHAELRAPLAVGARGAAEDGHDVDVATIAMAASMRANCGPRSLSSCFCALAAMLTVGRSPPKMHGTSMGRQGRSRPGQSRPKPGTGSHDLNSADWIPSQREGAPSSYLDVCGRTFGLSFGCLWV